MYFNIKFNTSFLFTINSNFKLGNALNILEKENVIIKKISYEEAKLEDVFLTLTGKNLRD